MLGRHPSGRIASLTDIVSAPDTGGIVLFGTLRDPELLQIVLGRVAPLQPLRLAGMGVFFAKGALFPVLKEGPEDVAEGVLLEGLSAGEIARLDYYEAPYGYTRVALTLEGGAHEVYRPTLVQIEAGRPWDLQLWQDRIGALTREAAVEIMALFGHVTPEALLPMLGPIRSRAQARLNARAQTPAVQLRQGPGRDAVKIDAQTQPYAKFFTVEELTLRHPRFDGGENRMERAVFTLADAVIVLPYDPVRDTVMLIEQFRAGPYLRGDLAPWSLEAIAGRIDGGETPEEAARREAVEEAGLTIDALLPISQFYPSPGGTNEYLYCFIGLADLPDSLAGLGGLESEAEDIRSMVIPFAALMDAVRSGEVQNGPLLVTALQLDSMRDSLRTCSTPA